MHNQTTVEKPVPEQQDATEAMMFSTDGRRLAGGGPTGGWLWDVQNGGMMQRLTHSDHASAVAFSPDLKLTQVATYRQVIR
jgi:hypothetical protein